MIYMSQPEGFEMKGSKPLVCLLKRSLYGLKQAPRQWYKRFDDFIIHQNFTRSNYDWCVYTKVFSDGSRMYLLLYVDDMLLACKDPREIQILKKQLSSEFDMKDLGPAKKILGMEIVRNRSQQELFLTQGSYLKKVVKRFGMDSCKPVNGPIGRQFILSSSQSPKTQSLCQEFHIPVQ
ncbi:hypothetical protein F511_19996 [Dorcoceras hygrometricum]|uniref:Reverse transcriptase Ty1/copia-type domain-containing protein n=1 Tax=Dorcoceras hygrometricum TaxID=472368 RepID=A0A2Z7A7T8_9LAMI|nr:hypothetical protein F511_19996 [Dorcoceras hygrometricum]